MQEMGRCMVKHCRSTAAGIDKGFYSFADSQAVFFCFADMQIRFTLSDGVCYPKKNAVLMF